MTNKNIRKFTQKSVTKSAACRIRYRLLFLLDGRPREVECQSLCGLEVFSFGSSAEC